MTMMMMMTLFRQWGISFARTWCLHPRKVLLKLRFRECPFGKCLFHQPGMLIILCVDDAGTAAPNEESTSNLIKELQDKGFDLEMEGDFLEYLGVGTEHRDDRTLCVTQKGSMKKIIAAAEMKECNLNKTPALTAALGSDAKGEPWNWNHWDHASVVRMLLCVSNNTRPDITFAVSQVA